MEALEYAEKQRIKRLRSGRRITVIAVAYTLLSAVLLLFLLENLLVSYSVPDWLLYVIPYSQSAMFLLAFFNPLPVLLPLALLPAAGCALLPKYRKLGRNLILIPQVLQLVMYALITPLHFFIGAGIWSMDYIRQTLLLGVPALALPVITLCGLHRWTDNLRFE